MRSPEQIDALLDKVEGIISEFDGAKDKYDRGCFADKYGDRLGQYSDKLKALNGDDFDIVKSAYDEHKNDYSDMSDDDYVNALEDNIKKVIARVWPEAPEEIKEEVAEQVSEAVENPDGETTETHIETEDKNGDGEISEDEVETHTLTSDENLKRTTGPWKSPCESGGRDGKCGLPGQGKKITSDEESKEEPKDEEEGTAKKLAEATPTKVDDAIVGIVTSKPEEVESEDLDRDPLDKRYRH